MDIGLKNFGRSAPALFLFMSAGLLLYRMVNSASWEPKFNGNDNPKTRRSLSFQSQSLLIKSFNQQPPDDSGFLAKDDESCLLLQSNCVILRKERANGFADEAACLLSSHPLNPPQLVFRVEYVGMSSNPTWQATPAGARAGILARAGKGGLQISEERFDSIQCQEIYPGVGWMVRGDQSRVEYDFVVAPQMDPGRVRLRFSWNPDVSDENSLQSVSEDPEKWLPVTNRIEAGGSLRFETPRWVAFLPRPCAYQEIRHGWQSVPVDYYLEKPDMAVFQMGSYQKDHPLFIDPLFSDASFYWKHVEMPAG